MLHFRKNVESLFAEFDDPETFSARYEAVVPWVVRGLLIHLMNDLLDQVQFNSELAVVVQLLDTLLTSNKEVAVFLERYLTQVSSRHFLSMVRRLQSLITTAVDDDEDLLWEAVPVLDAFYKANLKREEGVDYREFQNTAVNELLNIEEQYDEWLEQRKQLADPEELFVNMNNYLNYPWILDA